MPHGVSAAAEDFLDAGGHEALETLLGQLEAGGAAAAGLSVTRLQVADQIPKGLDDRPRFAIRLRLLQQPQGLVVEPLGARDADDHVHRQVDSRR